MPPTVVVAVEFIGPGDSIAAASQVWENEAAEVTARMLAGRMKRQEVWRNECIVVERRRFMFLGTTDSELGTPHS